LSGNGFSLNLPPETVEAIAERAAELVAERQSAPDPDGFLDADGAAEFLACSKSRIYSLVSAGRIPVHRDGSRLLFHRAELRDFVANGGLNDRERVATPLPLAAIPYCRAVCEANAGPRICTS
jgi:excisionase family DNA binding protein